MDNELIPETSWWKRNWKWLMLLTGFALIGITVLVSAANGVESNPETKLPLTKQNGLKKPVPIIQTG